MIAQTTQISETHAPAPLGEWVQEFCLPSVAAVGVVSCLVQTASEAPLPRDIGVAAFLFVAVFMDVRSRRIPNWLTFPALAIALLLALSGLNSIGIAYAVAGAGAALVAFGIPFACGWLGAGDVKAGMVLGALWGPAAFLGAAWWMVVCGGLLAVVVVALQRGGLKDLVLRWSRSAWYSLRLRRIVYLAPSAEAAAAGGLPFAVAMGAGASAFQIWGTPWF